MGTEDVGECSRKTENVETERPLKKAKYVWQVKGKYHLKASCQNKTGSQGSKQCNTSHGTSNCSDKEKRDIDKFLEKTETILDGEEEEEDEEEGGFSRRNSDIDRSISNEIPVTLVSPNPENQDYYLRKWQARQIARGYIDNTINSVLETWVSAPAPFDAEDFVENCDDDGHIEDEGILMAIQAHGLQSNKLNKKGPSLSFVRPDELADNTLDKIETVRHHHHHHHHHHHQQQQQQQQQKRQQQMTMTSEVTDEVPVNSSSSSSDDRDGENENNTIYPVDILNAAILVAIEKKGLSSFNHHE